MFSLHDILGSKPDHPMFDLKEAKRLLAELPYNDPLKALDGVTIWLTSVKDATGFRPELHANVIMLLDDTGQPFCARLLKKYLAAPHLQDFQGMHLWRAIHDFMVALAEAYTVCAQEYQHAEKHPPHYREQMPLICVRSLRAVAEQIKLSLMRYLDVEPAIWQQMYQLYDFAKANHLANVAVIANAVEGILVTPQKELLRALVLHISSPATLAPDHIEAVHHIAIHLVNLFEFKETWEPDCTYFVDLALPEAPRPVYEELQSTPTMRFFGAVKALPEIQDIIQQHEQIPPGQDHHVISEFTPEGKLTVLKHLRTYWKRTRPQRHHERMDIMTAIDIVHGFNAIGQVVTRIDLGKLLNLSEEDAAMLQQRTEASLDPDSVARIRETWDVMNVSNAGLGGVLPKSAEWVKIGDLCGIKANGRDTWWVGTIRRLKADAHGHIHFGMEILARKPLSVWLRTLGTDQGKRVELMPNWESSSGSFTYDYLPALLLPDAQNAYLDATLLLESGKFVMSRIHEVMVGEQSRTIKLTALLAEGDDYEQAALEWIDPVH